MTDTEPDLTTADDTEDPFAPLPQEAVPVLARALERAAGRVFKRANRAGQEARANLFGLGMSGLGGCTREAAYRISGTEPSDPALAVDDEARQAMVGTWIHAGFLPELAEILHAAEVEMKVELRVPLDPADGSPSPQIVTVPGSADCYTGALGGGVIDLKTIGAYKLGEIDHHGAHEEHRKQVRGYASACCQLGLPVTWIAWLYMDRANGDVHVVVEPFGDKEYEATLSHVRRLWEAGQRPDYAPRTERGPGLSWKCDVCPWLRRCWGPDAEPGDSRALAVHEDEEIALAARRFRELSDEIAVLEKEKERYDAMVGTARRGVYGEVSVTYGKDGEKLDEKEALAALELHGINPPMKPRKGSRFIRWAKKET